MARMEGRICVPIMPRHFEVLERDSASFELQKISSISVIIFKSINNNIAFVHNICSALQTGLAVTFFQTFGASPMSTRVLDPLFGAST